MDNTIPPEFKDRRRWLLWGGLSPRKRPHGRDKSGRWKEDTDAFMTYEEAVEAADEVSGAEGVGMILREEDDVLALDLDGCFAEPFELESAREWLPPLGVFSQQTFTEWSVSGTGAHVFLRGEVPDWWTNVAHDTREHEGVEVEEQGFFIFTGDTIEDAPEEIDEVDLVPWLMAAYRGLRGELPAALQESEGPSGDSTPADEEESTEPTAGTGNVDEIISAIDSLDARDVAGDTIVHRWNDSASTTGDNRAFDPTFGAGGNGTANIVDRDGWIDTGLRGGSGGPVEMAAIDLGLLDDRDAEYGAVTGDDWWSAVEHLRELGYSIPEYESGGPEIPEDDEEAAELADWDWIRTLYAGPGEQPPQTGEARRMAALQILKDHSFATLTDTEELWKYDEETGTYMKGGKLDVNRLLAANLGNHFAQREVTEVIGHIKARTYVDRDEFGPDVSDPKVCLENGVLDLETRELRDHTPDEYFVTALPVKYDPDADATAISAFLEDITGREEDRLTLEEMVGSTLWPEVLREKFLILFGEGSNGKTVFLNLVQEFLDKQNVSDWTLQELGDNRFAKSSLVGKLANIGGDMDSVKLRNTGVLKTLTGNDYTEVEEKGKPAFSYKSRATLLFAANRPPVIDEESNAIKRRIVPMHLPFEFTDDPNDGNPNARDRDELEAELTTEEELSGLLNLALDGMDRLRDNGDVSLPESYDERLEYYQSFSDPIKEFGMGCLENLDGCRVEKDEVYSAYKRFCEDEDYTIKTKNVFFQQLRRSMFDVNEIRPRTDSGSRPRLLDNAKFTERGLDYLADYANGNLFREVEPSNDESGGSTALASLEPGDWYDITAEVAVVSDGDYNDVAKGELVGPHGTRVTFKTPGGNANQLEGLKGETVEIDGAKLQTDQDGFKQFEINDGAEVRRSEGEQGNLSSPPGGDPDESQETVADGGEAEEADEEPEPDEPEPVDETAPAEETPDGEGVEHARQQVVQKLQNEQRPMTRMKLANAVDEPPTVVEAAIEKALRKGDVQQPADKGDQWIEST